MASSLPTTTTAPGRHVQALVARDLPAEQWDTDCIRRRGAFAFGFSAAAATAANRLPGGTQQYGSDRNRGTTTSAGQVKNTGQTARLSGQRGTIEQPT